jgi:hypothetical protein
MSKQDEALQALRSLTIEEIRQIRRELEALLQLASVPISSK